MKIKVAVIEDEMIIGDNIISTLIQLGYEPVGPAINYTSGIKLINEQEPDLVLLDINLGGRKDGIDLAVEVRKSRNIPIIFLTSHSDKTTIERAKSVHPEAYLVKPFNADEMYSAIEIAMHKHYSVASASNESSSKDLLIADSLFIKEKSRYVKLAFNDLYYLQSDHVYVKLVGDQQSYLVRSNMAEMLEKLPNYFIRIHRSYAINSKHLKAVNGDVVLVGKHEVPVSRSQRQEILSRLNLL